jgi:Cft2 family RNA processing exonuclease
MLKRIDQMMRLGGLPKYNVYAISKLSQRITRYFNQYKDLLTEKIKGQKEPFKYKYAKYLRRIEQIVEPAIVICTSGFGHAGASRRLLTKWAPNSNDSIIVNSGYIPPQSPLNIALEKGEFIENGTKVPVRADMKQIELSGHADQSDLIKFVKTLKPNRTFLVHGELEQAEALYKKISSITHVDIPEKKEEFIV